MGADVGIVGSIGKVVGAKLTPNEIGQINKLVEAGFYLNPSDFIREAVREKLSAIKVIEYRDVDYETAKKEVAGYFKMKGEAYASEASLTLSSIMSWYAESWMILRRKAKWRLHCEGA